jgi:hypothetical protein
MANLRRATGDNHIDLESMLNVVSIYTAWHVQYQRKNLARRQERLRYQLARATERMIELENKCPLELIGIVTARQAYELENSLYNQYELVRRLGQQLEHC